MIIPIVPITTDRVVIRPWDDDDAEAMSAAIEASTEHLRPWMAWIAYEPMALTDRLALIAEWRAKRERSEDLTAGIFLHDGTVVGGTGLHDRVGPTGVEIGYWVHVDHCGQGIATQAAGALAQAALALEHIETVRICHDAANSASSRVPAKLGFTRMADRQVEPEAPAETSTQWVWELHSP